MAAYSDYSHEQMFELLETLHDKYNREEFIEADPISIPHSFASDNDKEVAGFLAATIAWGNRKAILKGARKMMECMDNAPYDFVLNATESDLNPLRSYVYRTFNGCDFIDFIRALQYICRCSLMCVASSSLWTIASIVQSTFRLSTRVQLVSESICICVGLFEVTIEAWTLVCGVKSLLRHSIFHSMCIAEICRANWVF